jgi:hypothetical protein
VAKIVIAMVHQETIKPTVLPRSATSRVVIVLFCAATWATAQDRARNPDHRTTNGPVVPQAHVNPRAIILPVVEENGFW